MTIDFSNQISNKLIRYLPFTGINRFYDTFVAIGVELTGNKITLEFSPSDYTSIKSNLNRVNNPNYEFTISDFGVKNRVISCVGYPQDSSSYYLQEVRFARPHKKKKDDSISLEGFTSNPSLNTTFKVFRVIDPYTLQLHKQSFTPINVSSNFGYTKSTYTAGINGVFSITDEGSNKFSYIFDQYSLYSPDNTSDLYLSADNYPRLNNLLSSVKVIELQTFRGNLTDSSDKEYLVIDTSSLSRSPIRSQNNRGDTLYSAYNSSGYFSVQNSMNLIYIIQRTSDSESNQTTSSSDITKKQLDMYNALTSILRYPLISDNKYVSSSITVSASSVPSVIPQGKVEINYQLSFNSDYIYDSLLDIDDDGVYPIDSLIFNDSTVYFDNY